MFSAGEMAIFEVELSEGDVRHFDPLEVQDKLVANCRAGFNRTLKKRWLAFVALENGIEGPQGQIIPLVPEARDNAEKEIAECELLLVESGRKAFGFPPVDPATGDGIPAAVVLEVLDAFVEWRTQKKSSSSGWPASSPTGASAPSP